MTTQLRLDNDDEEGLFTNKTTMMANFEEWIKMATDNKINSSNSWNFALIDYFYDLDVLKDSENNINFQKASATLDGCVKIYSSRVDSVSNETGKLLSGLTQRKETTMRNGGNKKNGDQEDGENEKEGDESSNVADGDNVQIDPLTGLPISVITDMTKRRVHNRVLETTLVDFDTIKLKTLDQELNIDPLFKKALVDFDEGGAKSLLLNTLDLDDSLRVVFDASIKEDKQNDSSRPLSLADQQKESEDGDEDEAIDESGSMMNNNEINKSKSQYLIGDDTKDTTFIVEDEVLALGIDFIKFDQLASSEISSSIQQLRNVVEDISKAKSFVKNVNNKLDNFLTEEEIKDTVPDAFDGMDDNMDYYDDGNNEAMDSHGNLTARRLDMSNIDMDVDDDNTDDLEDNVTIQPIMEKDLMAYFDDNLNKNWRGREHWKVRSFKNKLLPEVALNDEKNNIATNTHATDSENNNGNNVETVTEGATTSQKKKKKTVTIDFFNLDDDLEDNVFTQPKKKSWIEMTQKLRMNDTHYLLPDDFHFSTEKITKLFIKQRQTMSLFSYTKKTARTDSSYMHRDAFTGGVGTEENDNSEGHGPEIADEEFWAETYKRKEAEEEARVNGSNGESIDVIGAHLENPFDDGDDNGIDFNQAFDDAEYNDDEHGDNQPIREDFIKKNEDELNGIPQKVNYSRVSKKVDVRRLKINIWKSVLLLVNEKDTAEDIEQSYEIITLSFKDIANQLVKFYPKELLKDISTSFCFICLLHLSNEHGLTIQNTENFEDLKVEYNKSTIQLSQ